MNCPTGGGSTRVILISTALEDAVSHTSNKIRSNGSEETSYVVDGCDRALKGRIANNVELL